MSLPSDSPDLRSLLKRPPQEPLRVGPGECLVVSHPDPARLQLRLTPLTEEPHPLRPEPVVVRRIRRTAIPRALAPGLLAGWCEPVPSRMVRDGRMPLLIPRRTVIHLIRATRAGSCPVAMERVWRQWARERRAAGDALILLVDGGEALV